MWLMSQGSTFDSSHFAGVGGSWERGAEPVAACDQHSAPRVRSEGEPPAEGREEYFWLGICWGLVGVGFLGGKGFLGFFGVVWGLVFDELGRALLGWHSFPGSCWNGLPSFLPSLSNGLFVPPC